MAASEVVFLVSFDTNFLSIASIVEAETSMSGKAECLLATVEDKKSKLFRMTFPF